ncbi:MAG TPA: CocE/NonD family hydrolase [Caulobacteraceae bacterium]|jgi:hypothetical protein
MNPMLIATAAVLVSTGTAQASSVLPVRTAQLAASPPAPAPAAAPAPETRDLDSFAGRYLGADGCPLTVTRSARRLYLDNGCTGEWRGLTRRSPVDWDAGATVISEGPPALRVRFAAPVAGRSPSVTVSGAGAKADATANRREAVVRTEVTFKSADGVSLAGTVTAPLGAGRKPAIVLVHGSGEQDRHGYASIIDVLAAHFLEQGFVVLQYDKRGSGASGGDWRTASFKTLAEDALAGRRLLLAQPDVDPARVGVGGSSQAGWISAMAVKADPAVPFVFLIGAGGAALTVEAQDDYNVSVGMRCAGVAPADIERVMVQRGAFFDALRRPAAAARLRTLTEPLAREPKLADWVMPAEIDRSAGQWFVALETGFDPLPVWRVYRGRALFAFGGLDDQTPGPRASQLVRGLRKPRFEVLYSERSQHLGLLADDPCKVGLEHVSRFDKALWADIDRGIAKLAAR